MINQYLLMVVSIASISCTNTVEKQKLQNVSNMGILDFFKKISGESISQEKTTNSKDTLNTQKQGYLELINIGLGDPKKGELVTFINNLKDYNGDSEYMTTLSFVMSYLDQNEIHFIMALDWNQEIQDLEWRIRSSLRDNFNIAIDLPDPEKYGKDKSVSYKYVFKEYDQALRNDGFQLSFIDTNSDEYVIIVHKIKDEPNVVDAIKQIGYDCLNANSSKISPEM